MHGSSVLVFNDGFKFRNFICNGCHGFVYNNYFDNLVKAKKLETKNILIDKKNYEDLMIYFTRYVHKKSIKILSLHYHELMENIEEHEGKKYLIVDGYMLNKELDNVKEIIGIEQFDNIKILIDTVDKFPDNISLKNFVLLITCVIKDDGEFYPQIFLEEELYQK